MPYCRYCGEELFDNIPHVCDKRPPEAGNSYAEPPINPYAAPQSNPYAAPQSNPYAAPQSNPYAAPQSNPYAAPQSNPYAAPQSNPCAAPGEKPRVKPSVNLDLKEGMGKVKGFFTGLVERVGVKDSRLDYFERNKKIVPDNLDLEDGEIPVRQYDHIATLQTKSKLTRAHGRLQITNKRVIFRANGFSPAGKTVGQQIYDLDKLDGIEIRRDFRFRILDTFFAIFLSLFVMSKVGVVTNALFSADWFYPFLVLLALASCVPVFLLKGRWLEKLLLVSVGFAFLDTGSHDTLFSWLTELELYKLTVDTSIFGGLLMIPYCICLFMYSFKPNLLIEFKVGGGNAIQIRHKEFRGPAYSGFAEVQPGKDVAQAIQEINTIIHDIKTLGDLGIEKWKEQ